MMIPFPVIKEKGKKTGKAFALVLSLSFVFVCFAFPFFLSYFFVKKYLLVGGSGVCYCGSMDQ